MAKRERRGMEKIVERAREVAGRLADALGEAVFGRAPEPQTVRVRQPTAEELRRYARQRRRY